MRLLTSDAIKDTDRKAIEDAIRDALDAPLRLLGKPFADFPDPAKWPKGLLFDDTSGQVYFSDGTSWQTFFNAGDVINLTAGGIKFPATQVPSADANTLDDYEEGTWTPALDFGGGATGLTYSSRTGRYTKIGRLVAIEARITLSNKGSSTGSAHIRGLPFAIGMQAMSGIITGFNLSSLDDPYLHGTAGDTQLELIDWTGGSRAAIDDTNFANTSDFFFGLTYSV